MLTTVRTYGIIPTFPDFFHRIVSEAQAAKVVAGEEMALPRTGCERVACRKERASHGCFPWGWERKLRHCRRFKRLRSADTHSNGLRADAVFFPKGRTGACVTHRRLNAWQVRFFSFQLA